VGSAWSVLVWWDPELGQQGQGLARQGPGSVLWDRAWESGLQGQG